jgi:prepilin-type N-terminal cleavage/methylation domain-containing protein
MKRARSGFTIVELMISIVVLTVGLLALLGTSTTATRSMGKSRRVDFAANHANRRLEVLRSTVCTSQASGADTLFRSGAIQAVSTWTVADAGNSTWRIYVTTTYLVGTKAGGTLKHDVLRTETAVSCLI